MPFHSTATYLPGDAGGACYFCASSQRTLDDGRAETIFRSDSDIDHIGVQCICETCSAHRQSDGPTGNLAGEVCICETCAIDLARLVGYASPEDVERHIADVSQLRFDLAAALEDAAAAGALADALRAYDARGSEPQPVDENGDLIPTPDEVPPASEDAPAADPGDDDAPAVNDLAEQADKPKRARAKAKDDA